MRQSIPIEVLDRVFREEAFSRPCQVSVPRDSDYFFVVG